MLLNLLRTRKDRRLCGHGQGKYRALWKTKPGLFAGYQLRALTPPARPCRVFHRSLCRCTLTHPFCTWRMSSEGSLVADGGDRQPPPPPSRTKLRSAADHLPICRRNHTKQRVSFASQQRQSCRSERRGLTVLCEMLRLYLPTHIDNEVT